jgi:serine/threonine-protein kinase
MSVKFDFKKRLGSGYFGEVWYANEIGLCQECAVKLVPYDKIINQANYFQEAQCLKAAEHQNVVRIFDTGYYNKTQIYLSMEFLKNGSLEDEAQGGYIALTRAKKIMVDVLRGLEHAHKNKILHRDIKPANILIGDAKEGKLSDFGLALPDFGTLDLTLVKTQYQYLCHLAPEVNHFTDYTELSDIYACGVTFYRLINGDSYLPNVSLTDMRQDIKSGKYPDRTKYRDFIPKTLRIFTNKAMSPDISKRFQSTVEMRHALEQIVLVNNLNESITSNGMHWSTGIKTGILIVDKTGNNNLWNVEIKRGKNKSSLKRIVPKCLYGAEKKKADLFAKVLLQQIVQGKIQ